MDAEASGVRREREVQECKEGAGGRIVLPLQHGLVGGRPGESEAHPVDNCRQIVRAVDLWTQGGEDTRHIGMK